MSKNKWLTQSEKVRKETKEKFKTSVYLIWVKYISNEK